MVSHADGTFDKKKPGWGVVPLVVHYLTSMRFALFLLGILGFLLLLEAILPNSFIRDSYAFALVCLTLVVAVIACSLRSVRRSFRRTFRGVPAVSTQEVVSQPFREEIISAQSPSTALVLASGVLRSKGYRVFGRGGSLVYADRGWIGFPGSLLLHVGLVLVVVGMSLGAVGSFDGSVLLTVGQSFTEEPSGYERLQEGWKDISLASHRGFQTRLDGFEVSYGEDFQPEDYVSRVTILEDGTELVAGEIRVNEPLSYKGVKIYQSSYGWAPKVRVEAPSGEVLLDSILWCQVDSTGLGSTTFGAPGSGAYMSFVVVPDQVEKGSAGNRSPMPNNPALFFVLSTGHTMMVAQDVPLGSTADVGGLLISFEELERYSGLQVTSKPEIPVVYSGFAGLILGLFLVFYVNPRWVWVLVEPQEEGSRITLGGSSKRKGADLRRSVGELAGAIKRSLGEQI